MFFKQDATKKYFIVYERYSKHSCRKDFTRIITITDFINFGQLYDIQYEC